MHFIYEILPVFLFFIAFKVYDIYVATIVGIGATAFQVVFNRLWFKKWDNKQIITLVVFLFFGGMTLYFHNPIFVKWKPTIVFWIFSLVILFTQAFTYKPIMQRLMEHLVQEKGYVPPIVWARLNLVWGLFFFIMGTVNLYIAYYLSNDAWVNFKFYGVTTALFIISILQALYLMRFMTEEKANKS